MCDSFLLTPKCWTHHSCCIYYINISLFQWRLWGNLHRQKCSGAEDPTKGGRRAFLASKTSTLEQRDGPSPYSWACRGEAVPQRQLWPSTGAASRDNAHPHLEISHPHGAWATRRQFRQFTHAEYGQPTHSRAQLVTSPSGEELWHGIHSEGSQVISARQKGCSAPDRAPKNMWPSKYQATGSADFFHWVVAEGAVVSVTKWMTC